MKTIIIYLILIIVLILMLILPFIPSYTSKRKRKFFDEQIAKLPKNFKIDHRYEIEGKIIFLFDLTNKKIAFVRLNSIIIIKFKEFLKYKIDDTYVYNESLKQKLCSDYILRIFLDNPEYPEFSVDLLNKTFFTGNVLMRSNMYENARDRAQKLSALFEIILNKNKSKNENVELVTKDTKELREQLNDLKEMVYAGLITESEYEEKRKQILGL